MTTVRALGRHVEHDPRSRDYPYRVAAAKPKTILWSIAAPVLDQGQVGSCTGNALAQWLNTSQAQARLKTPGFLDESKALELYSLATRLDGIRGVYPPDDTGSSGLGVCKAGKKLGYLTAYQHAFGFDALLMALQHSPVIVGTEWTKGMFDPNSSGVIRPTGPVEGGHEYLVRGCDIEKERITMRNSWSVQWGDEGDAYISFRDFDMLLRNQGDIQVPII